MDSAPKVADTATLVDALRGNLSALVVCLSRSWGGLEQVAASDAIDAGSHGLPVRVLCLQGTPIHEHLAHRPEVAVVPIGFRPRNYFDFGLKGELHRLVGEGVNLIHTHQTSLLGSISPWLYSRPAVALVASRHIMNNHDKRNFFHRAIYRRVDALLAMSQALKKNILETHPVRERQVKVVNLGLDFDRFDPARVDPSRLRAEWGADEETLVVGLVGRIDPAKGQATFIRAAAGLLKASPLAEASVPKKLKFVIVGEETRGSDRNHLAELKDMVAQFRLGEHVVFAGFRQDVPEVMRAFDLFVMPSRQEAFGLVAIEAMAMQCPVIVSGSGSAEEIVGKNEFGMTVKPDDAFDLQHKIRRLIEDPALRREMGRRGREHVKAEYDRAARLRQTLEVYERVLRRRMLRS